MTVVRHLRAVALVLMVVVAAIGGATAASAAGASHAGPAVTEHAACAGRSVASAATGACTSSVVAPADVVRSTAPFRRLSAGASTATPRPAWHDALAVVEAAGVVACPCPPPDDNHSRAPPAP